MLTGSHNPANYNGLKIVLAGETLSGDSIQKLKERIFKAGLDKRPSLAVTIVLTPLSRASLPSARPMS
jgi:phosphomannomutase